MNRIQLDDLTSDQLDALYDRLEKAESAAACARGAVPRLREALEALPALCWYHGVRLDPDRFGWGREACCDTGVPARRRREATAALDAVAQAVEPIRPADPATAPAAARQQPQGGPDPRKPAWDAVFAFIGTLPRDAAGAVYGVERNALIWHAVDAALVALGYPSSYGDRPYPGTTADSVRTSGHAPAGHVGRVLAVDENRPAWPPPTGAATIWTVSGQQRPDILSVPFCVRPDVIRLTVLGTRETPTNTLVVHLPESEPDPYTTPDTDPWAAKARVDEPGPDISAQPRHILVRPDPSMLFLELAVPLDDGHRFLSMYGIDGSSYPPIRTITAELWVPTEIPGKWARCEFGPFTGVGDLELDTERMVFKLSTTIDRRTRAQLTAEDTVPPPSPPADQAPAAASPTCTDTVRTAPEPACPDTAPPPADTTVR